MNFINIIKALLFIVLALVSAAYIVACYPVADKTNHAGISEERATELRKEFTGPHHLLTTADGATLFLRRWNPDRVPHGKIAILILHGITAYSGPYAMAGIPFAEHGYTTFGLDYRGHGLSSGNRGDTPGKERWIKDMAETVAYIKDLGFSEVVVLGHSLGVAAAFSVANAVPNEIAGLIMLSGAYEGREGVSKPPSFLELTRLYVSSVLRPSYQVYQYYREGMTVTEDSLFNFRYTPRFLLMLDAKKLRLPAEMNIPVLVGIGDEDELFTVEKVRELYDLIPGDKKEFLVMKNATHANIPRESWLQIVDWLDRTYTVK
ncbi:alpha/beta hydrolase [Catalinimonas niigatensis]|uniref:alpha/beta hydrolase n=1 Tax=Catalinimonas niigatensis TaxID=1397264 RepID=UPI002666403C|nr:alpha/beta fold hydrolase [Catalinimonas niigatensis]WPP48707.1 alpha/beta fold hydrolase [Catalinimonas niigatensis]